MVRTTPLRLVLAGIFTVSLFLSGCRGTTPQAPQPLSSPEVSAPPPPPLAVPPPPPPEPSPPVATPAPPPSSPPPPPQAPAPRKVPTPVLEKPAPPKPPLTLASAPWLILIPGTKELFLAVVPEQDLDLFFSRARVRYYYHWEGRWYSAGFYKGPWAPVGFNELPEELQKFSPAELKGRVPPERLKKRRG